MDIFSPGSSTSGFVSTVGPFAAVGQPNGATISGHTITFGPADLINPGMIKASGSQQIGLTSFTVGPTTLQAGYFPGFSIFGKSTSVAAAIGSAVNADTGFGDFTAVGFETTFHNSGATPSFHGFQMLTGTLNMITNVFDALGSSSTTPITFYGNGSGDFGLNISGASIHFNAGAKISDFNGPPFGVAITNLLHVGSPTDVSVGDFAPSPLFVTSPQGNAGNAGFPFVSEINVHNTVGNHQFNNVCLAGKTDDGADALHNFGQSIAFLSRISGDYGYFGLIQSLVDSSRVNGDIILLPGVNGSPTEAFRVVASTLDANVAAGNLDIATVGKGLKVAEGSNAKQGTFPLGGTGTDVIANTSVTATSRIFLTSNADGGTPGNAPRVSSRVVGTSFTVKSTAGDTSTVAFEIYEQG